MQVGQRLADMGLTQRISSRELEMSPLAKTFNDGASQVQAFINDQIASHGINNQPSLEQNATQQFQPMKLG